MTPPPRAGQAAALNQDGTINSTSNPAALRSIVVLYATGAGVFQPLLQDGVSDITAKPVVPVSVVIAGQLADLLYAGPAPGLVAGALQIHARVPMNICGGGDVGPDPNRIPVQVGTGQPDFYGFLSTGSRGTPIIAVNCNPPN